MGLQVSKEEIIANLMREQAFQDQNRKFDKEQYVGSWRPTTSP
jgi:hypothetical protein